MRLIISEQQYFFENNKITIKEVLNEINKILIEKDLLLSHVTVDGVDVFVEIEEYLQQNKQNIKTIEVKTTTIQGLLQDALLSMQEYINRTNRMLPDLAQNFYNEPSDKTWHLLGQLLEGIQWMKQTEQFIHQHQLLKGWIEFYKLISFDDILNNLEEAVEQQDWLTIGDIISYEIIPKFEAIAKELRQIIDSEVVRNDLN